MDELQEILDTLESIPEHQDVVIDVQPSPYENVPSSAFQEALLVPEQDEESEQVDDTGNEEELEALNAKIDELTSVLAEQSSEVGSASPVYLAEDDVQVTALVSSDIFPGSFNSSVYSFFEGVMSNNAGKDYVAWRDSQYIYKLYYGNDFIVEGDVFSGSGSYVTYNTDSRSYNIARGSGDFTLDASGGVCYTNVSNDYAGFPQVAELQGLNSLFFALVVGLGIWVCSRIFFRFG